jgi:Lar family restriction alleviation protein
MPVGRKTRKERSMRELKPCPFCGGEAKIKDYTDRIYGFGDYQIVCSCGVRFNSPSTANIVFSSGKLIQTRNEETKKIAYERMIEAWNRRAGEHGD